MADAFRSIERRLEQLSPRHPIAIVGAAKAQSEARIREAVSSGLRIIAMNYVQEGERLRAKLSDLGSVEWHFIGHVQSRKAKALLDYDCLQSLDRIEIAETLDKRLQATAKTLSVLIEVNIGGESSKSGIAPDELEPFLLALKSLPSLSIKGLMGMPPPLSPVELRRPFFKQLRLLYDRYAQTEGFDCLSMGTSEDYEVAVEEGTTMIRLGTTLFGAREGSGTI